MQRRSLFPDGQGYLHELWRCPFYNWRTLSPTLKENFKPGRFRSLKTCEVSWHLGVPTPARLIYSPAATRTTTGSICKPPTQRTRFWEKRSSEPASREPPPTASVAPPGKRAMSNAGIGLRIIQEISGHSNLEQLQRYERCEAGSSQRSARESFHAFLQRDSSFSRSASCPKAALRSCRSWFIVAITSGGHLPHLCSQFCLYLCLYLLDHTRCLNDFCNTLL